MPYFILHTLFIACVMLTPNLCVAEGIIPNAASTMSMDIHKQLDQYIQNNQYSKKKISVIVTTPAMIDDLTKTNTLAKQMTEELMHNFVKLGYRVKELRKGEKIRIDPKTGEFILTREKSQLAKTSITSEVILAGTYTITNRSIIFNMRLLHTPTNDIIAMSSAAIPITNELKPLIDISNEKKTKPNTPSTQTKLPGN